MIPLLKKLKQVSNNYITVFIDSPFVTKDFLIYNNFPADKYVDFEILNITKYIIKNIKYFDNFYLDYSSSSIKNIFFAAIISKKIRVMRKNKIPLPSITFVQATKNTHAAVLNTKLYDKTHETTDFALNNLKLCSQNTVPEVIKEIIKKKQVPISIQISSANLKVKYKNWSSEYWIKLFKKIVKAYPNFKLILLGDENEIQIGKKISNSFTSNNIIDLTGKTNLINVSQIIQFSSLYIGLDSGLMHLAVALGKPTFSIFGASSYSFVGYEQFDNTKHKVVHSQLKCWPCHGFMDTNKLKVSNPINCHDIKCMETLTPKIIFKQFEQFVDQIKL